MNQEDTDEFLATAKMLKIEAVSELALSDFQRKRITFQADDVEFQEKGTISEESGEIYHETAFESCDDNTNASNTMYIQNEAEEDDDEMIISESDSPQDDEWNEGLTSKKQHQVLCSKNIPFFKSKLCALLSNLYDSYGLDIKTIEEDIEVKLKKNPRWMRSVAKCPFCKKMYSLHARLTKDKNRFLQWNISTYRKHFLERHEPAIDSVSLCTLPIEGNLKVEVPDEDYGDYEVQHLNESVNDDADSHFLETDFENLPRSDSPTEYVAGSIVIAEANATTLKKRLIRAIKSVLNAWNADESVKSQTQKISFSIVGDPARMKAMYQCCVCKRLLIISYSKHKDGKFRQWATTGLKKHLGYHT